MSSDTSKRIPVVVAGALGRMGAEVVKAVYGSNDCYLVGAIDNTPGKEGLDIGEVLGMNSLDILITSDLEGCLCQVSNENKSLKPSEGAVFVDFTHPSVVYEHTRAAIAYGIHPVIGTTGLSSEQLKELADFSCKASIGTAIIPNFSIGMVLLQQAAAAATRFYEYAELIELHHNKKVDAPSGTCIKTAEMMEEIGKQFNNHEVDEKELIKCSRGGLRESGIRVHSVRLPGLVAHQEVIFGSNGETYTLRHDTIDRTAYMPGVLTTIRKVRKLEGLIYGLEKIIYS